MGDSNIHNHKRCPLFFAGKAGGALKGGLHIKAAEGTPMANAMLAALQGIGVSDLHVVRRQHGAMDLSAVQNADRRGGVATEIEDADNRATRCFGLALSCMSARRCSRLDGAPSRMPR